MVKTSLDIDFVRQQFPALTEGQFKDTAFFENAGGSYVPYQVLQHLDRFMVETKVQPYAPYAMSVDATNAIEQATIAMAGMINARPEEVVIGHCTTMNLYILSMALLGFLQAGDEIIVTNQDHEANISPWRRLQEHGIVIREWSMQESGELSLHDLAELLSDKTALVCMPHSSNIIGSVNDVASAAKLVHEHSALLMVDGVSYAPHHAIDVMALGVDIYALSLYKLFGPHLGLLYVNTEHHGKLKNQSLEFMPELYAKLSQAGAPNDLRIALNPGYVNHEEAACLLGVIEYFQSLYQHHNSKPCSDLHQCMHSVFELIEQHESRLADVFLQNLRQQQALQLLGQDDSNTARRAPTYALTSNTNKRVADIARELAANDIAAQSGCFYAWRCLRALGVDPDEGVLRISMAHFNSLEETERLNKTLNSLI